MGPNTLPIKASWNEARKRNHTWKKQYQEKSTTVRAYAKLTLDDVFRLLDAASGSAKQAASELKALMSNSPWNLTATLHEGGKGGIGRPPDEQLHFNINILGLAEDKKRGIVGVKKNSFHIRCKELPRGGVVVFSITH